VPSSATPATRRTFLPQPTDKPDLCASSNRRREASGAHIGGLASVLHNLRCHSASQHRATQREPCLGLANASDLRAAFDGSLAPPPVARRLARRAICGRRGNCSTHGWLPQAYSVRWVQVRSAARCDSPLREQRREQRAVAPRDAQRGTLVVSRGTTQLKVGLRVGDLEASCALYLRLGFKQIPRPDEPQLRYLTFGHTWLISSDKYNPRLSQRPAQRRCHRWTARSRVRAGNPNAGPGCHL
jgi:hypothetical protein